MNKKTHLFTELIQRDMHPSLGVTEPGAIAFAVAKAKEFVAGEVMHIQIDLNSGMYKNAFTCGIPKTEHIGFNWASALGYTAGNADLGLEALNAIDMRAIAAAQELIDRDIIDVSMTEITSEIFIRATVQTDTDKCSVTITHFHTNITSIVLNGKELYIKELNHAQDSDSIPEIHRHSFSELLQYACSVPLDEISFIQDAFLMNLSLLEEGLSSQRTVIAHYLLKKNHLMLISDDILASAQLLCAGAIESRVLGIGKPAMSITGSGSHGIIATMPLYALAQCMGLSRESLFRSAALSILITQYIKEYSGKLSAMCGCGVAAGTGMACALTMLRGGSGKQIEATLCNMSLSITGMICDGGNHGCALKAVAATDIAFRASDLALSGVELSSKHGIVGYTPEETMRNIGHISSPGMFETERAILDVFREKLFGE